MAQPALQLVGVGAGHLGQVEGEGVAQVVGPQGRELPAGVVQLGVVPAADLLEDQVDRAWREPAIGPTRQVSPTALSTAPQK